MARIHERPSLVRITLDEPTNGAKHRTKRNAKSGGNFPDDHGFDLRSKSLPYARAIEAIARVGEMNFSIGARQVSLAFEGRANVSSRMLP